MARYLPTKGSGFTPFSYEELTKPLLDASREQDKVAEAYDVLGIEAGNVGQHITNNKGDDRARAIYQNYITQLGDFQQSLWDKGLGAGTRKDLAAARQNFGQVVKIKEAIEKRQKRSQEYWDAKHKDPSLVTGRDPGLDGIDDYLDNESAGQNWYHYSGDKFTTEVGTDAKARVKELLRDLKAEKLVPGYITMTKRDGATSQEVNTAGNAVRKMFLDNDFSDYNSLEDGSVEKLLADVAISHINASGAKPGADGNIDSREFGRLVEYGIDGLSHSIGETSVSHLQDLVWKNNQELALERAKHKINHPELYGDGTNPTKNGWKQDEAYLRLEARVNEAVKKDMHRGFYEGYVDEEGDAKPRALTLANGEIRYPTTQAEAGAFIYNTEDRKKASDIFDGLDITIDLSGRKSKMQWSKNNVFRVEKGPNGTAIVKRNHGKGRDEKGLEYDAEATQLYNLYLDKHNRAVAETLDKNPEFKADIKGLTMTPKELRDLRKQYNIPDGVQDADVETAILRGNIVDKWLVAPTLVGADSRYNDVREDVFMNIRNYVGQFEAAGNTGKSSVGMFYPVLDGGYDVAKEGLTFDEVFGPKGASSNLLSAYILPEDVIPTKAGDVPKARIVVSRDVKTKNGGDAVKFNMYQVDARALGSTIREKLSDPNFTRQMVILGGPIMNPGNILAMNDSDSEIWATGVAKILGPQFLIANDDKDYPSAKDVVRSDEIWSNYNGAILQMLSDYLALNIDDLTFMGRQHPSDGSEKAARYKYVEQKKKK